MTARAAWVQSHIAAKRFLRFEGDLAIDNGPDLNVYLVAGVPADGDVALPDDDGGDRPRCKN